MASTGPSFLAYPVGNNLVCGRWGSIFLCLTVNYFLPETNRDFLQIKENVNKINICMHIVCEGWTLKKTNLTMDKYKTAIGVGKNIWKKHL